MADKSPHHTVRLAFVGDVSFGDCLFCQGMGIRSLARQHPPDHFFKEAAEYLRQADIAFCNLETVLSRNGEDARRLESVEMRGDPERIESLKIAGFTAVNLANNHTMQHGPRAFQETVEILRASSIAVIGLRSKGYWHCKPVVIEKRHKKLGILGYSFEHFQGVSKDLCYADGNTEKILADIGQLRNLVDFLVVSLHWGLEFMDYPSEEAIQLAHAMIDAGADAIIGHHPHVLQGIEVYKNRIIAYSLGNFLFDMLWSREYRETTILIVSLEPDNQLRWRVIPARITLTGRVAILKGDEARRARNRLDLLAKKIGAGHQGSPLTPGAYIKAYNRKNSLGRLRSYVYFLRHFHSYRKQYLLQQVRRTISSRVEDLLKVIEG